MDILAIQQLIAHSAHSPEPLSDIWVVGDAYHKFFYFLTLAVQPRLVVELGTLHGRSAVHLAAGAPNAKVIGIDWDLPALPYSEKLSAYPNLEIWQGDTTAFGQRTADLGLLIDVLFIDSTHEAAHATKEFDIYWPLVKPGGILLVDDIYLGDMRSFWDTVPEPKFVDETLHGALGFGVCLKE